jgi:hypothetical protein
VAGGTYPAGIFKTFIDALVGLKKVKKDTTETEPLVPPGSSTGGVSDSPSVPDTGEAIEGGGAPPASTPVPQLQTPAEPAPEQPEQPAQPAPETPPEQPSEPAPETGGAQPAPGEG